MQCSSGRVVKNVAGEPLQLESAYRSMDSMPKALRSWRCLSGSRRGREGTVAQSWRDMVAVQVRRGNHVLRKSPADQLSAGNATLQGFEQA